LDASQTDKADRVLKSLTKSTTIDFQELDYISSAGLGSLLACQKRLKASGNGLILKNLNSYIKDIFRFTGFDKIFEIH
jgi:anti-sigma B factor antagonist